jgi:hypothetical protein
MINGALFALFLKIKIKRWMICHLSFEQKKKKARHVNPISLAQAPDPFFYVFIL